MDGAHVRGGLPEFPWHSFPRNEAEKKHVIYYSSWAHLVPGFFRTIEARESMKKGWHGTKGGHFTRQTRRHADVDSFECSSIRNFFLWNFEISGMSRTDRSQLDSRPSSSSSLISFTRGKKKGKKKTFSRFVPLIGYNKHRQGNNDPGTIIYNIFNRTSYICIGIYRCVVYV